MSLPVTALVTSFSSRRWRGTPRRDGPRPTGRAAKLAARVHVDEGTLAQSLLSSAVDDLDPDPANVASLLDGLDGAFERAQPGAEQAAAGDTIPLDER